MKSAQPEPFVGRGNRYIERHEDGSKTVISEATGYRHEYPPGGAVDPHPLHGRMGPRWVPPPARTQKNKDRLVSLDLRVSVASVTLTHYF